jgi:hypothetical protein
MWAGVRIAAAVAAVGSVLLSAPHIIERQEVRSEWRQQEPFNTASSKPPLHATIAELYYSVPEPGRRVILQEPVSVRDTLRTVRPVISADGRRIDFAEELVFVEDPRTRQRLAILKAEGVSSQRWIELMPIPRNVARPTSVERWPPLVHWSGIWLPGWADANEPYDFMWLGVTSEVLRVRDLSGPADVLPYRVSDSIRAGSPGGPSAPGFISGTILALWLFGLACAAVAVAGGRLLRGVYVKPKG